VYAAVAFAVVCCYSLTFCLSLMLGVPFLFAFASTVVGLQYFLHSGFTVVPFWASEFLLPVPLL